VPPPPPSHSNYPARPAPSTHREQDHELHAHFLEERRHHQYHQSESQTAAQYEEKRSSEYELRHSQESSIPVRSSLTLMGPTFGASPPRKPLTSKTAAIIAAHSRPPAGVSLPGPFTTPGNNSNISRLLSSVTSLQSHVSGSSSLQGLAEGVSVLAGPKPSYANPTVAFTSKHRSPNVSASHGSIHPPSSSGDINAGNRREKRSTSSSRRDSASPPRRRGGGRSANNTHSSERPLQPASQDSQRAVEWAHVNERNSSGNVEGSSGSANRVAIVYPDLLSPNRTLELVHDLVGRSLIHEHQSHREHHEDRTHSERRERKEKNRENRSLPPRDSDRVRSSV